MKFESFLSEIDLLAIFFFYRNRVFFNFFVAEKFSQETQAVFLIKTFFADKKVPIFKRTPFSVEEFRF